MSFDPVIIQSRWLLAAVPIYLALLVFSVRKAHWRQLRNRSDANVFYGATVVLWMLWQVQATVDAWPGLEFHLLLLTTATLMFGWAFAFIAASIAQLGLVLQGSAALMSLPMAVTVNAGAAIAVSYLVHQTARHRLPQHFFVYVFVSCVFGGALAMLVSRLAGMSVLVACAHSSAGWWRPYVSTGENMRARILRSQKKQNETKQLPARAPVGGCEACR